jgi:hypothetical protein
MDRAVEESQLHGGEVDRKNDIKRVGKSAQGNNFKFPQQIRSEKYSESSVGPSIYSHDYFIKDAIRRDIAGLHHCCAKGRGFYGGCLLKKFGDHDALFHDSADWSTENKDREEVIEAAIAYVKVYRDQGKAETKKDREKRDGFIQEIFRGCILSEKTTKASEGGSKKFEMQYEIPSLDSKLGKRNRIVVCLDTMLCVYGISSYEWRICNEQLRRTESARLSTLRHQKWEDDHLHDYTLAEVENVFLRNLKDSTIASKLIVATYIILYNKLHLLIPFMLSRSRHGTRGNNSLGRSSKISSGVDERLF